MLPIAVIGQNEILIIAVVAVLLFGVKKIPELGKGLAEGITEFKKASKKAAEDTSSDAKPAEPKES